MKEEQLTLIYWKGEKFWLGKLKEYPEIMTQGETLQELEENMHDAFGEPATLTLRPLSPKEARGFLKDIDTMIESESDRF